MWIDNLALKYHAESIRLNVWSPQTNMIVLGSSNLLDSEVDVAFCNDNNIEVFRRSGGGGTVVLFPGCVVVSLGLWVKDFYENGKYFCAINKSIIASLSKLDPALMELSQKGISDIAIEDKKLVGTSMFRSRNYLLFQASILVDIDFELINGCLRHPSAEPDYREGRAHKDFMIGLADICGLSVPDVALGLKSSLINNLQVNLKSELISPQSKQFSNLRKRYQNNHLAINRVDN